MKNEIIMIVEDDKDIRHLLDLYLQREFKVILASDGKKALELFHSENPDLILLDIMIPEMNGLEVCRKIRTLNEETPILFLSSRSEYEDRISGLEAGADDYIIKPFDPGEVFARVKAHLRRKDVSSRQPKVKAAVIRVGDLELNMDNYTLLRNGKPVPLYTKEMHLLIFLMQHPNQVFSIEQIYDRIWGEDKFGDYSTVKVHISNLRKKLERNPAKPELIVTVRGFGYKFSAKN